MRQNAVIDILLIIIFSLALLISGKASAGSDWKSGERGRELQSAEKVDRYTVSSGINGKLTEKLSVQV